MLEMYPSADAELNNRLHTEIFRDGRVKGTPFILASDGEAVGILELLLPPKGNGIVSAGILPEFRGRGYGDFFTRAALFRLSEIGDEISVSYVSAYFEKFGFARVGNEMKIRSETLIFPHECGD